MHISRLAFDVVLILSEKEMTVWCALEKDSSNQRATMYFFPIGNYFLRVHEYFRWLFNCELRSLAVGLIYRSIAFLLFLSFFFLSLSVFLCSSSRVQFSACSSSLSSHAFNLLARTYILYYTHLFINFVFVTFFSANDGKQLQFLLLLLLSFFFLLSSTHSH